MTGSFPATACRAARQQSTRVPSDEVPYGSPALWQRSHAASQAQCEETIVDTQGLLADAESELAATIENIAFLTQAIADGTALRAQQAADYAVSQAKHQKAIDALSEAVRIINNL